MTMDIKKHIAAFALIVSACTQHALATSAADGSMAPAAFQQYVLKYLQDTFKQHQFVADAKVNTIKVGNNELNLDTAYQSYKDAQLDQQQLNLVLKQYYGPMMQALSQQTSKSNHQWQVAKTQVRPQLASIEYLQRAELVHQKLDDKVIATFVIDDEHSYKYVTAEHLKAWGIGIEELAAAANANLVAKSANMPMNIATEGDRFIVIKANDGYDAARIMVPEIRSFITEHLGEPFYAAMPYRDILLVWSAQNSDAFFKQMKLGVEKDFNSQQYALSPHFFEVSRQSFAVVEQGPKEQKVADEKPPAKTPKQ